CLLMTRRSVSSAICAARRCAPIFQPRAVVVCAGVRNDRPRAWTALALSFAGAALMGVPAHEFRIDRWGDDCSAWPPFSTGFACSAVYLAALALLALGWRRACKLEWPLRRLLAVGFAVHLVALIAPPFLSLDTLCYSAVGRAMAAFHQSAYAPLRETLPAGDRFLTLLPAG